MWLSKMTRYVIMSQMKYVSVLLFFLFLLKVLQTLLTILFYSFIFYGLVLFSINLLVVYRESVNLIGYITRRLSADSLQL